MKFLVLGCNGMAGHLISLYLKEQGHQVLGFARIKSKLVDSVVGDVTNTVLVRDIIDSNQFDSVVNCIGILNQFAEENKALAVYLNSYFPHFLAYITERTKTQIIHISTDCVFSGKRGQYAEKDVKDGETFYDRSKALGELDFDDDKNLTLRQSLVGPDMKEDGIGLMNWFLQQEKGVKDVKGYSKFIWTGITTLELAKVIEMTAKEHIHGLYNMVPSTSISKYDLLCLFNVYLRKEKIKIMPFDKIVVDKSLRRTNWDFKYNVQSYEAMIAELAVWMREHKFLYPHYL